MIKISPVPDESYRSHDFVITVNGINLDAYKCRVSRIPFNRVWPGYQDLWIKPKWRPLHIWQPMKRWSLPSLQTRTS